MNDERIHNETRFFGLIGIIPPYKDSKAVKNFRNLNTNTLASFATVACII